MKMFEERILRDGKCLPGGVLKVDGFINHQMDPALMMSLARELARRFGGEPLDRVLTVEASGIAPAVLVGYLLGLPVVFAKKKSPSTMENALSARVRSFTKGCDYDVCRAGTSCMRETGCCSSTTFWPTETPRWACSNWSVRPEPLSQAWAF